MLFKLGELFCGPGGLALGAATASPVLSSEGEVYSIRLVWGVDKDPYAIETYKRNLADKYGGTAVRQDAEEFCRKEIFSYPRITALAFGFPCNDFSLVGKRKGVNGQYGRLYRAGVEALNQMNPFWFIAENVSGIHAADEGKAFDLILKEMRSAGKHGYNLTAHLYRFEEYGIPQYRHRFIVVGIRKDKRLHFKVPAPTHGSENIPYVSVQTAISKIPKDAANSELTRQNPRVVERLLFTPPGQNAWFLDELLKMPPPERQKIIRDLPWYEEALAGLTDEEICRRIDNARLRCTKARMSHIYRRLLPHLPSYTITGSGGGGTHVYHWKEHRCLTNRERARIQSFPDDFVFCGSKEQVRKQIGMAVPPQGGRIIFEAVLKTFAEVDYPSVEANYSVPD